MLQAESRRSLGGGSCIMESTVSQNEIPSGRDCHRSSGVITFPSLERSRKESQAVPSVCWKITQTSFLLVMAVWRARSNESITRLVATCLERERVIIPQQGTTSATKTTIRLMVTTISRRENPWERIEKRRAVKE